MCDLNSPNSAPSTSRIRVETSLSGEYEVFLSFCGKDTRNGFTDFLYTYLQGAGVRTFRDDNELRVGEEIGPELTKAIENSKICIPIFSKNYASSKWCLPELAHVVKCHAEANGEKMIFPIFYDVEPHDVRHQSGSYQEVFRQHEKNKRLEVQTVQIWKEALAKVGQLKGLELKKETGGREGELVKLTVEKCLHFLKKDHQHVPTNMVGMENHIRKLKSLLEVDSNEVRIVGIHGMGGLGKTTMAKIIYNQLCQHFEGHCFLENVRENSSPRERIVNLQSQLISKIQNRRAEQFNNFNEGCSRIKEAVRGRKLLIVLDDADENFQVDMLVGHGSWFGVRSRIIITTRNKSVLNSIERACQREDLHYVYASYGPEFMDELHSLQLFSKYAFKRDSPFEEYNILSKEVVSIAAGLPLVLVVLGSTFSEVEGVDIWEENVRKLREIPNGEVVEKLRFSFEALTHEQKEIFLDIACLFIEKNVQICSYMWDDCKYYPRDGINSLINKSLVTIGSTNEFKMHDQLRDLGRQIVHEESLKELGKRSRLWREEEAMDVLETNLGTSIINALCLPENQPVFLGRPLYNEHYESVFDSIFHCDRQEFFNALSKIPFSGSPFRDEPYLKYNYWAQPYFVHAPFEIPLSGSCLQNVANLRYLRLGSRDIDGDFLGLFSKLRWLQWKCVGTFKPKNLRMKNLVILDLSYSSFTDDWEGWNQINFGKKLKHLDLSFCKGIRVLGHFSMCTSLEILNLSGSSVCRLDGLGLLKALKYLNASKCYKLETLSGLSNMTKLVQLQLAHCTKLREIQGLEKLESLQDLCIRRCTSLRRVPDLSNLKLLKNIDGNLCVKLIEIVGLEKLESLENLTLGGCESLKRLAELSMMKRLKYLNASSCVNVIEIRGMEKHGSLEYLTLEDCGSLELSDVSNLKRLKAFDATECAKLIKIAGLEKLELLEYLYLGGCVSLVRLPDVSNLKMLRIFEANDCVKLIEIAGLEKLESLENLHLRGCISLERLPDVSKLKNLKRFEAQGCVKLIEVEGMHKLNALEYLDLRDCISLKDVLDISNLDNMKVSIVPRLGVKRNIDRLRLMFDDQNMSRRYNNQKNCLETDVFLSETEVRDGCVKRLPDLSCLKKLKHLEIVNCDEIQFLCGLESLETLLITDCSKLVEIQGLDKLQSLTSLIMVNCPCLGRPSALPKFGKLKKGRSDGLLVHLVEGLGVVESLEELLVSSSYVLRDIPDLRSLKYLKKLTIHHLMVSRDR